ncbi:cell wall hydrolase [Paenibacillus amylolyticus]|nr:cell wall hydrolase [Paenibacillus amylolyticus]WFR62569.1 cell wall hydrolase [Paenibacillus amylolyticus]
MSQDESKLATWSYSVSDKELHLLQKIVMAEAEGEPYEGKVAVANVVLNRLRSANFPDTIYKVIYQKSQFSPVANGRLKRVVPNEDSIKAVNAALNGKKEVADDTYYFLSLTLADDLTVARSQKKVKTIGHHTFYK